MTRRILLIAAVASFCLPAAAQAGPAWITPITAVNNTPLESSPNVAVDAASETFVAYKSGEEVFLARRPAGGSFGKPVMVDKVPVIGPIRIAVDSSGDVVLGWLGYTGGVNVRPFLATVSSSGKITNSGALSSSSGLTPAIVVASNPAGAAAVAWTEPGSQNFVRVVTRGTPSQAFGSLTKFGAIGPGGVGATTEDASNPVISVDGNGNVVLAYNQSGKVLEATGPQWPVTPISLSQNPKAFLSSISSSGGNTIIAWNDEVGSVPTEEASMALNSSTANVTFSTPIQLSDGVHEADEDPGPIASINSSGAAVVAWQETLGGNAPVIAAIRPAGGSFTSPQNEITLSNSFALDLGVVTSVASDGIAQVGWQLDPNNTNEHLVQARAVNTSGGLGAVQTIAKGSSAGSLSSSPDLDASGESVFGWEAISGSVYDVSAYVSTPPSLGAITAPGALALNQLGTFSVPTPLDTWSLTSSTTWSFGDGASAVGTSVTHSYSSPGVYTVTVTVSDTLGNAASTSAQITVAAPSPTPPLTPSPNPVAPHAPSPPSSSTRCVVPNLSHLSLSAARSKLKASHCVAGKVTKKKRPRSTKGLAHGVVAQSPKYKRVLAVNSKIAFSLGWFKAPRRR